MQTKYLGSVDLVAGRVSAPLDLIRGVKTHALLFDVLADVTIAGAAGGAVQPEGLQSLIDFVRLSENAVAKTEVPGPLLAYLTNRDQLLASPIGALANADAQANTLLRGVFALRFATLIAADPGETAFVELNSAVPAQVRIGAVLNQAAALITGAGLVVNRLSVGVYQEFDPITQTMPLFLPRILPLNAVPVPVGAQNRFVIPIVPDENHRLESVIIRSVRNGLTDDNLWNGPLTLRGDSDRRYLEDVEPRVILAQSRATFPGIEVTRPGWLELHFRKYGKLSEMFKPGENVNLRIEAAVNNPGGDAQFQVFQIGREPVRGFTGAIPADW